MATVQPTSQSRGQATVNHLRLVWALASKDIVDALKTKTTLTTIVISVLMVFFYRTFPTLTAAGDTLRVRLYAESDSILVAELERSPALAVYRYDSRQELLDVFADAQSMELALVISDETVAQQQAGQPVTLEGHVMYWISPAKRAEIRALVEDDLTGQLGQPVTVDLSGGDVYFNADNHFFAFSATIALLFIAVMIGISLIPNLMVEEREAKTLDALLVSPASAAHLVVGKALAGLFYGLVGSAIVLIVFGYLIIQWPLAILAAVLATLFMVAVGLLLGSYVTARAQLQLIAWFIVIPLLLPVILVEMEGLVPNAAISAMRWVPTVLLAQVFQLSLTPNATFTHYGTAALMGLAATLALLALVVVVVRRLDGA